MKNTKVLFAAIAAMAIGAATADDWQEIFKAAKDTYIFAYFGNEREGMKLAASEDGLNWRELNDGRPVLVPEVGKEKLLRDPSVVQGPDGTFHAVWTTSWRSPEIGYASSKDLIVYCDGYGSRKYYAMRSSDGGQTWEDISKEISLPKGIRHGTAFKVSGSMFNIESGETK